MIFFYDNKTKAPFSALVAASTKRGRRSDGVLIGGKRFDLQAPPTGYRQYFRQPHLRQGPGSSRQ